MKREAATRMKREIDWRWAAQCVVVLLGAFALKLHYSTASADDLRWILAPTSVMVEIVSGVRFEFESGAGYLSREENFLIAGSCAGVNFLIAAFLVLTLRRIFGDGGERIGWGFLPKAAGIAYLATIAANAVRIAIALEWRHLPPEIEYLGSDELHRLEGIVIYFGFLLLLFVVSEAVDSGRLSGLFRGSVLPLLVYYAVMLGVPLLNGGYRQGGRFWEHAAFVLLLPLLLVLPLAAFRYCRR